MRALFQALGKSKEDYVMEAQNKTRNAQKAAIQAAFNLFKTELDREQSTWDALQLRLACSDSVSQLKSLISLKLPYVSICHSDH